MTWFNTLLSGDQVEVVDLANDWLASVSDVDAEHDDGSSVKASFVESGLWSIGIDETWGGGGAPLELRLAAFVALGAHRPALAWASAQAHAAVEALGAADAVNHVAALIDGIVSGQTPVCVVERSAPQTRLEITDGHATGSVDRIDPAGTSPALVILDGDETAWLVQPPSVGSLVPLRRTGLAGASTSTATVGGPADRLSGVPVPAIRARLHRAGAAIAAGIAVDAAERAIAYSTERVQFGAPLRALPTVQQSLATQSALARECVTAVFDGDSLSPAGAAWSLRENVERAISVAASSVQSHGGYGYIREYGVERLLRDAVSLRAATDVRSAFRASFDLIPG
ncbi:acyl-CoA dehydrogenase [Microbacterium timonense]|uniref:acyl-CoA dehydrogenase n=1 Tax=Microbacterium timonense TaxID=2086576 RepID=UPI000D107348|nr:acyl-CoA dehydrogenase [Microbacterium timonense]